MPEPLSTLRVPPCREHRTTTGLFYVLWWTKRRETSVDQVGVGAAVVAVALEGATVVVGRPDVEVEAPVVALVGDAVASPVGVAVVGRVVGALVVSRGAGVLVLVSITGVPPDVVVTGGGRTQR